MSKKERKTFDRSFKRMAEALHMYGRTSPVKGYSDRGFRYACNEFREGLDPEKVCQSMGRKGNCPDNAVAGEVFQNPGIRNRVPSITDLSWKQKRRFSNPSGYGTTGWGGIPHPATLHPNSSGKQTKKLPHKN